MARQLTGKQQAFLNVLFDEAGGNMVMAKKMAGVCQMPQLCVSCQRSEGVCVCVCVCVCVNAPWLQWL